MNEPTRRFPWQPAILPLLEIGCFVAACAVLDQRPLLALGLLLAAALALSFSVHVFFHECIHYSMRRGLPRGFTWAASVVMGLPFDGYRVHHVNHHRYDNGEEDFSSTWQRTPTGRRPFPRWSYVLGWPRQSIAAGMSLRQHAAELGAAREYAARMPQQRIAILLSFAGLTLLSWPFGLLYIALVYLGWAAVALQNYGQHDPRRTGEATTLDNALYNRLLFNNGLHWEHHARPELAWNELQPDEHSTRISLPHILEPLTRKSPSEVTHV